MNEKEIKINITDSSGVTQLIEFDFRKYPTPVSYYDVKRILKELIQEQLNLVSELFSETKVEKITFSLEQENEENENVLACFIPELSLKGELRFSMYYPSLVKLCEHQFNKSDKFIEELKDTILHELIHALDLQVISEDMEVRDDIYNKIVEQSSIPSSFNASGSVYNLQLAFLSFLRTFRDEGVAILGQKLLGSSSAPNFKIEEAYHYFQRDFQNILQLCESMSFYSSLQSNTVWENIQKINLHAYSYAEIILLFAMGNKIQGNKNTFDYYRFLQNDSIINTISKNDKINLLKQVFEFDLSEYIQGLMRLKSANGKQLVDHNEFYHYCGIMQEEFNDNQTAVFMNGIIYAGFSKNRKKYIEVIKNLLGYPMPIKEIIELFETFRQDKHQEDIVADIIEMAEKLLQKLKTENSEVAQWALTYLLDDEDLIFDSLPYFGFQDDWLVLNSACIILK